MTIVQQPDNLSFCGNLKDFIITGETEVTFSLSVNNVVLITETYTAHNNKIVISCKNVVEQQLDLKLPEGHVFVQTSGIRNFRAVVGDTTLSFKVIKGGMGDVAEVSSVFLKSQFLTLQPQQKHISVHQPEFLSYYTQEACRVKVRAYFPDGTNEEKYIANLTSGRLYTLDFNFLRINGEFEKQVGYYDVWIENTAGNRLTYIQRYILTEQKDNSRVYVFENTLGGLDTVCFTGLFSEKLKTTGSITTIQEESSDSDIDFSVVCEQDTGYIPAFEYARWLRGFFLSPQRYHVTDTFRKIYIEESENAFKVTELNSYTFEFCYSRQTKYYSVIRNTEVLPELLEFPAGEDLFFLAPRLAEFPIAAVADDLMLPVQFVFENQWRRISMAAVVQAAISASVDAAQGSIDLSQYWQKTELVRDELYLKFLDRKISAGYADQAGDSEKWNGKPMSELLDQPVRTTDDVQFLDILGRIITLTEGLMTDNFVAGMTGTGVGIVDKSEVHMDKGVIRKYLEVLALVVAQMFYRGGRQVLSPAGLKVNKIVEGDSYYRLYMDTDSGQVNGFTVGAQARCNRYGSEQRYWWRLVTAIGIDYIDVSKTDMDTDSMVPAVGDEVVQFGHRTDPYLQWVVMDSAFSDDAGRSIYAGVNGYSLEGKLVLREGVSPTDPSRIGLFTKYGEFSDVIDGMNQTIQEAIAKTVQVTAPGQVFKYGPGYTGTPTPAGIVLTAAPRNFTPTSYQWQYLNGSTWTNISGATGATYSVAPGNTTLFPSGTNVRTFRCICNGDEKLSDSFTIAKLADGATGATGSAGADAYTVLLTNEAHAFAGSASAALAGSTSCQIIAYKGATQVAVTIGSITGLPTGMTASTSNNGTTSATVTFAVTTSMTTASGTISIPLTVDGKSFTRVFSYSVAFRGATGATGAKGETGPTGSQGIPGTSQYFHVKYSANSNGNPMSDTPNTYIGTVVTSSATAPTGYTSYKWVQLKGSQGAQGTQGIPGVNGTNGKTTYLHIKYSDNGTSFTANNGETPGAYIGQYTDFTAADSMTFSAYTWTKVKGETGSTGAPGAQGIPGESITGKMLFKDPMFAKGINGVSVYSNAAADVRAKLTVERVYRPSDAPTKGSYCLRITCKAPQSPDYGGVVQSLFSRANAVFIQKIIANIPVGYAIRSATNSMGSGYKDVWLTSCAGTGKYETYLRKVTCGASGTFSSGGHVYISGSPVPTESAPLIWHIAYMTAFDMTDDGYADIEYDAKNDLAQQLGFTDYAALEANALTRGPLINAGLINAVLINTAALAADTAFISNIKTKVLTAGSITAGMLASNFVFTKQIQIGPNASTINFKVDSNGVMTAKGADITGRINATMGSFGNIQISGNEFISKNGGTISFKRDNDSVRMFSGSSRLSISIANNSGNSCLYLYSQSNLANPCLDIMRQVNGTAITSYGGCTFCIRNGEEFAVILPNNGYIQGFKVTNNSVIARVPVTFDSRLTLNGIPQRSGSGNWRAVVMNLNDRRIYWQ